MKELSKAVTLTIPEDSPIYKALMESTKQNAEQEHQNACLEADLEETTNILTEEIDKLKKDNEKLKEENNEVHYAWHQEQRSIEYLIKKIKELKKDNEKLKKELKKRGNVFVANSAEEL